MSWEYSDDESSYGRDRWSYSRDELSYDSSEERFQQALSSIFNGNVDKLFLSFTFYDLDKVAVDYKMGNERGHFSILETYAMNAIRYASDVCSEFSVQLFFCLEDCDNADYFPFKVEQLTIQSYQGWIPLDNIQFQANKVLVNDSICYRQLLKNSSCKNAGFVARSFSSDGSLFAEVKNSGCIRCLALRKCNDYYKCTSLFKILPFLPENTSFSPIDKLLILVYFGIENQGIWTEFLTKELYDPRLLSSISQMAGILVQEDLQQLSPSGECEEGCENIRPT